METSVDHTLSFGCALDYGTFPVFAYMQTYSSTQTHSEDTST